MLRRWTSKADIQRLLDYRKAGWSYAAIGKELGIHHTSAADLGRRHGAVKLVARPSLGRRSTKPAGLPTRDPAILAYRREKKRAERRVAPIMREAKQELERLMAHSELRRINTSQAENAKRSKRRSA